ncbi:MAG: hypothetical protein KF746_21110 [Chitinophagaceae bacterium]|nr:hypothetical protein [Chitinophagaceae bacterium]
MKKIIVTFTGIFFVLLSFAQQQVEWSFFSKKINDNTYEIHLTASIEKGWVLYSQFSPKKGAVATVINITPVKGLSPSDKFEEKGVLQKRKNVVQDYQVEYFENQVDFVREVTVRKNAGEKPNAEGSVSYITSNGSQTLPRFTVNFSIPLN